MFCFQVPTAPQQMDVLQVFSHLTEQAKAFKVDKPERRQFKEHVDRARMIASNSVFNAKTKPHLGSSLPVPTASLKAQGEEKEQSKQSRKERWQKLMLHSQDLHPDGGGHHFWTRTDSALPRIAEADEEPMEVWKPYSTGHLPENSEKGAPVTPPDDQQYLSDTDSEPEEPEEPEENRQASTSKHADTRHAPASEGSLPRLLEPSEQSAEAGSLQQEAWAYEEKSMTYASKQMSPKYASASEGSLPQLVQPIFRTPSELGSGSPEVAQMFFRSQEEELIGESRSNIAQVLVPSAPSGSRSRSSSIRSSMQTGHRTLHRQSPASNA